LDVRLSLLAGLLALAAVACDAPAGGAASGEGCTACHPAHHAGQGACEDCHRGNPATARKELAHHLLLTGSAAAHRMEDGSVVREGAAYVERAACRRCHTIGGTGNRLATDLSAVVWTRSQEELAASIDRPVESMPRFGFGPRQVEALIACLVASRHRARPQQSYRVRFAETPARGASAFDDRCGGCHRVLTPAGARGSGSAGPNLSGLFSGFYPATAPGGSRWTPEALRAWLKNPRAARPATTMPPPGARDEEVARILDEWRNDVRRP
jgi:cytochrome c2